MFDGPASRVVLEDAHDFGTSGIVFARIVLVAIGEDVLVDGHPEIGRLRPR